MPHRNQPTKRISKSELEVIKKLMRMWPETYRTEVSKLYAHINWQMREIDSLEKALHEYRQADFFKKAKELESMPNSVPPEAPPKPVERFEPLWDRLQRLIAAGDFESDELKLTLKWNNISLEQAKALVYVKEKL